MFADWLLAQLAKRNWTQTELAKKAGLTKQAITNYVNGRIPDNDAISKIASALRISVEEVYRVSIGKSANPAKDPWVEEMAHKLDQLPPNLRDVAGRLIDSMLDSEEASQHKSKPNKKPAHARGKG